MGGPLLGWKGPEATRSSEAHSGWQGQREEKAKSKGPGGPGLGAQVLSPGLKVHGGSGGLERQAGNQRGGG